MERRSTLIISLVLQAALLGLSMVSTAVAQERDTVRIVVEKFMGSKANRVRGYVIRALSKRRDVELVPSKNVVEALTRLGVTLESEKDYVALSRELKVNAFVDGEVTRNANGWTASLWVRQGNGKFIGQHNWEKKKSGRLAVITKTFWEKLGDTILSAQVGESQPESGTADSAPETQGQKPADTESPESLPVEETVQGEGETQEPVPVTDDQRQRPKALNLRLAFGTSWRNNSYEPEDAEQPYRYYNKFLQAAPWIAIQARWFPAAHFTGEWFAHIGLAADFGIGLGASSKYEDKVSGQSVEPDTATFAFSGGLFGRIPLDPVELGLTFAYGQRVFKTSGFEGLPDVAHSFLRFGATGDISIVGGFGVDTAIAYLLRLDSGELASEDYFPELSGGGVEGGVGVYYEVIEALSVRADWSVQYFFFDTGSNDVFEDLKGASDTYYSVLLGVAYELGAES